jgi:ring-1,2-phenylacetyl-CoA epoxidase subunit PaaD
MSTTSIEHIEAVLDTVCDPEIPVLTIRDLGILRGVQVDDEGIPTVVITPTYSGCPAMGAIEINIRAALQEAGVEQVYIKTVLSPAWTTEWLSPEGREKLHQYGIAPPADASSDKKALMGQSRVLQCPHCGSDNTTMLAQFASTSCKAMFRCGDCLEVFDYFKCH